MSNICKDSLVLEDGKIQVFFTGVQSADLNMVLQQEEVVELASAFEKVNHFFKVHNVSWTWIVRNDLLNEKMHDELKVAGYLCDWETTAMFCNVMNVEGRKTQYLKIRECHDLNFWGMPLLEAFDSTEILLQQYIQAHQRPKTGVYHYVGFLEETPVTALTVSMNSGVARLDDVGTIPKYQRNGYASELIRFVLDRLKDQGIVECYLGASTDGMGVYKNIGFQEMFKISGFKQIRI